MQAGELHRKRADQPNSTATNVRLFYPMFFCLVGKNLVLILAFFYYILNLLRNQIQLYKQKQLILHDFSIKKANLIYRLAFLIENNITF